MKNTPRIVLEVCVAPILILLVAVYFTGANLFGYEPQAHSTIWPVAFILAGLSFIASSLYAFILEKSIKLGISPRSLSVPLLSIVYGCVVGIGVGYLIRIVVHDHAIQAFLLKLSLLSGCIIGTITGLAVYLYSQARTRTDRTN